MKSFVREIYKKLLFDSRRLAGVESQAVLLGEIRAEQIRLRGRLESLDQAEFRVFSQWGEDGILSWLVDTIKPASRSFVEFGVEDFHESNCRYLLISRGWSGLVIDGGERNVATIRRDPLSYKYDFRSICSFITKDNINTLLQQGGATGRIGILSVDIDGVDYWVLDQIRNPCDIIVVEYNDIFGERAVSVPYDESFVRLKKHWSGMYWGANLAAFKYLLEARGYAFVGTNKAGTNAFFVASEHREAVMSKLDAARVWPSSMREVRNEDGSLALKTYAESASQIAMLPLVEVTTGRTLSVADVLAARK